MEKIAGQLQKRETSLVQVNTEAIDKMKVILMVAQQDSRHRPIPDAILSLEASSLVKHLNSMNVNPNDYEAVYLKARQIYNAVENQQSPFNVDYFIRAVSALREPTKSYKVVTAPTEKKLLPCNTCRGSKFMPKIVSGKIVGIERDENGNFMKCKDCE